MIISTLLQDILNFFLHKDFPGEREVRGKETILLFPPATSLITAHNPRSSYRGVAQSMPVALLKKRI